MEPVTVKKLKSFFSTKENFYSLYPIRHLMDQALLHGSTLK